MIVRPFLMLSGKPLICVSGMRVRLVPQTLRENESLSSFIDHQAQLWGLSRSALTLQVSPIPALAVLKDLDACRSSKFLNDYATACGTDATELRARRVDYPPALIGQRARHAYCPLCFEEDLNRNGVPYFRVDWARMLLTHCAVHKCPLFRWHECTRDGLRKLPHAWFMGERAKPGELLWYNSDLKKAAAYAEGSRPRTAESTALWKTLVEFESTLYRTGVGSPWYRSRRNLDSLEDRIMRLAVKLVRPVDGYPERSLIKTIQPSYEDHDMLSFTLRRHRDRSMDPSWRELRGALTSLPCRRAVLLVVAQQLAQQPHS